MAHKYSFWSFDGFCLLFLQSWCSLGQYTFSSTNWVFDLHLLMTLPFKYPRKLESLQKPDTVHYCYWIITGPLSSKSLGHYSLYPSMVYSSTIVQVWYTILPLFKCGIQFYHCSSMVYDSTIVQVWYTILPLFKYGIQFYHCLIDLP